MDTWTSSSVSFRKNVEIEATLTVTSVDSKIIDALLDQISALPGVHQAFWSQNTTK